ncbi:endonuclease [Massilia sp. PAMC28688]|uniref:endonuclease n=1 Tax=Massilia sp. PAMC28688 TaxID=2861283 RepID=UPI001C631765|nr:endonuclease [Massilia sp. PAMC28688]QYF93482.1 endonuclease [Massilia sp. PAMC28688]
MRSKPACPAFTDGGVRAHLGFLCALLLGGAALTCKAAEGVPAALDRSTPPAVHAAIGPVQIVCPAPQKRFPQYDREARAAFWDLYRAGGVTVYCAATFKAGKRRTAASALPINIEHVVPQSQLKRIRGAAADPHNMWPSIEEVNSARQNWRLVNDIPGETLFFKRRREPELAQCDFEVLETGKLAVVEPAPPARGKLARAVLHMYVAYPQLRIGAADIRQMLEWHAMVPVSDEERRRNDDIAALTGVRNAFVDAPDEASRIVTQCRATPGRLVQARVGREAGRK